MKLMVLGTACLLLFARIVTTTNFTKVKPINQIENITASILKYNENTLQMKVKWKIMERSVVDVTITPNKDEYCSDKLCSTYGISQDIDEIILPRDPMPYVEHRECSIMPGCTYNIKVATSNRAASKSIIYKIPDCVEGLCSCKHANALASIELSAETISTTSIRVKWKVLLAKQGKLYTPVGEVILDFIVIRVIKHRIPSLSWGGMPAEENNIYSSLNLTKPSEDGNLVGSSDLTMKATILPDTKFRILGYVQDNFGCHGPQGQFDLTAHAMKSDAHNSTTSLYSNFISIVLPVILIMFVAVCVGHYIYKTRKKSSATSNWTIGYISNTPRNMVDNIVYDEQDIYEVPSANILKLCIIGKGAFGVVFKAVAQNLFGVPGSTIVAVKELKRRPSPDEVEEFLGEIQTMKNVGRHENVVELLGYCTKKEPMMMIMEYVGQGDLLRYLWNVRNKHMPRYKQSSYEVAISDKQENSSLLPQRLKYLDIKHSNSSMSEESYISQPDTSPNVRPSITETMYTVLSKQTNLADDRSKLDYVLDNEELHNFALQIAKGMRHIEAKKITHRDLAARNILIDERKTLKISDFGLSRPGIYVNTKRRKLPLRWLSLEAIRDHFYSSKSDVWAFAVVLWEIGTLGGFPYPTINNDELLAFLSSGKRLERPEICSESLYELMLQCWDENPDNRPFFKDIVNWLQPQNKKTYVDFSTLGSDYVFPPTRDELLESKCPSDTPIPPR